MFFVAGDRFHVISCTREAPLQSSSNVPDLCTQFAKVLSRGSNFELCVLQVLIFCKKSSNISDILGQLFLCFASVLRTPLI